MSALSVLMGALVSSPGASANDFIWIEYTSNFSTGVLLAMISACWCFWSSSSRGEQFLIWGDWYVSMITIHRLLPNRYFSWTLPPPNFIVSLLLDIVIFLLCFRCLGSFCLPILMFSCLGSRVYLESIWRKLDRFGKYNSSWGEWSFLLYLSDFFSFTLSVVVVGLRHLAKRKGQSGGHGGW